MDPVTTIDNLPECGRLLRQIKIEIKEMEEAALNARTMDIEELKKAIRGHRAGRKRLVQQLGQLLEEQKIALNIHVLSGDDFPIRVCPWQSIKGIQLVPLGRHPELMADDREVDDYQLRDGDAVQLATNRHPVLCFDFGGRSSSFHRGPRGWSAGELSSVLQAAWISILIKQLLGMQPFNNSRFIAFVSSPPSRPSSATLMDVAGMDGIKLRKCAEREDHLKKTLEGNMWLLSHDGDGKDSDRKPYRKKFFRPLPLSQLLEDLQEPEPRPEPDCKLPTLCWHVVIQDRYPRDSLTYCAAYFHIDNVVIRGTLRDVEEAVKTYFDVAKLKQRIDDPRLIDAAMTNEAFLGRLEAYRDYTAHKAKAAKTLAELCTFDGATFLTFCCQRQLYNCAKHALDQYSTHPEPALKYQCLADPFWKDRGGRDAFDHAVYRGDEHMLGILLQWALKHRQINDAKAYERMVKCAARRDRHVILVKDIETGLENAITLSDRVGEVAQALKESDIANKCLEIRNASFDGTESEVECLIEAISQCKKCKLTDCKSSSETCLRIMHAVKNKLNSRDQMACKSFGPFPCWTDEKMDRDTHRKQKNFALIVKSLLDASSRRQFDFELPKNAISYLPEEYKYLKALAENWSVPRRLYELLLKNLGKRQLIEQKLKDNFHGHNPLLCGLAQLDHKLLRIPDANSPEDLGLAVLCPSWDAYVKSIVQLWLHQYVQMVNTTSEEKETSKNKEIIQKILDMLDDAVKCFAELHLPKIKSVVRGALDKENPRWRDMLKEASKRLIDLTAHPRDQRLTAQAPLHQQPSHPPRRAGHDGTSAEGSHQVSSVELHRPARDATPHKDDGPFCCTHVQDAHDVAAEETEETAASRTAMTTCDEVEATDAGEAGQGCFLAAALYAAYARMVLERESKAKAEVWCVLPVRSSLQKWQHWLLEAPVDDLEKRVELTSDETQVMMKLRQNRRQIDGGIVLLPAIKEFPDHVVKYILEKCSKPLHVHEVLMENRHAEVVKKVVRGLRFKRNERIEREKGKKRQKTKKAYIKDDDVRTINVRTYWPVDDRRTDMEVSHQLSLHGCMSRHALVVSLLCLSLPGLKQRLQNPRIFE
ncbi:unnamed protein product [Symbiodinium sp. KB8]|nr:unnamed protein product [Symbiodinium sp. KB8]